MMVKLKLWNYLLNSFPLGLLRQEILDGQVNSSSLQPQLRPATLTSISDSFSDLVWAGRVWASDSVWAGDGAGAVIPGACHLGLNFCFKIFDNFVEIGSKTFFQALA